MRTTSATFPFNRSRSAADRSWPVRIRIVTSLVGKSPASMRNGVKALVELLPHAQHETLAGQTHIVKPPVLAPVLAAFFAA